MMYRISLSVILLLACYIGIAGVPASAQSARSGRKLELPRCIADAAIQLTASPTWITPGQSSVVSWSVVLPTGCAPVSVRLNGDYVPASGSKTVSPYQTLTYTLTIRQTLFQKSVSTQIVVDYPERVVIDPSTPNPVQTLIGALGSNPVVIELCNVELDLTGYSLVIGDKTSLIASPDCARGPRKLGPRIFVRERLKGDQSLFVIRGDNVLFSGFRLEGPTPDIGASDKVLERGIRISPFECVWHDNPDGTRVCTPDPIKHIEISNMEIYHWSGAAIEVMDNTAQAERGRLFNTNVDSACNPFNTNVGAVCIQNNYIHHNRHGDGYGYGVSVTNGAYALIQRNVFDENRHAIMGNSAEKDLSGYTARENLILPGGGRHCSERCYFALTGWRFNCWQTHQIDMHGNKSFGFFVGTLTILGSPINFWKKIKYSGCCGIAGETIIIERNTILYAAGKAIKIRGNPYDKAVVDGNVFTHYTSSKAIEQNGDPNWNQGVHANITNPIQVRPNNVFGVLPLSDVGRCDFIGDGPQDTFAATGVTWWAWSPATKQWRYMNTMPEPFSKLQLGDFDNDGKCDVGLGPANPVVPPNKYSKSGIGPWTPVIAP